MKRIAIKQRYKFKSAEFGGVDEMGFGVMSYAYRTGAPRSDVYLDRNSVIWRTEWSAELVKPEA